MPITKKKDGWYWGSKGPYKTLRKAEAVASAARASGYGKNTSSPKSKARKNKR